MLLSRVSRLSREVKKRLMECNNKVCIILFSILLTHSVVCLLFLRSRRFTDSMYRSGLATLGIDVSLVSTGGAKMKNKSGMLDSQFFSIYIFFGSVLNNADIDSLQFSQSDVTLGRER